MTSIKIILSALLGAVSYGILHDIITAHFCVEYFTVGHPRIIESESPILLALLWGVIATWWLGLPMGVLLAGFSQWGNNPKLAYKEVIKLMLKLVAWMFAFALVAGIIGFTLTKTGVMYLVPQLADQMEVSQHSKFLAAGWAHGASYLSGIVGTIVLCVLMNKRRRQKKL